MPNVNIKIKQQIIDDKKKLGKKITWRKIINIGLKYYQRLARKKQ